ncbi:MAG: xanthine dehydrogenase family protein molybdopterin-binding subunit, partial [Desulfobacteraceae bacterium]|nr:xanthine dehydrogenase family protein molybdopterin-binding subunit [Desulfobacteraceae bacterium]
LTDDLRLKIKVAAADIGQGSNETICRIVSDAFGGFPLDQIDFIDPDTAVTPDGYATGASRFTEVVGNAALKAARKLIYMLKKVASEMLDSSPEDVVIKGHVICGSREASVSLSKVVETCKNMGLSLSAVDSHQPPPTEALDDKGQGYGVNQYAYATYIAEVEVDTDTGEVQVLRVSTFIDAGKMIRQKGAEMQVDGGTVMGLGHTLTEEFKQSDGQVETNSLANYLIPSIYDIPQEITYNFIDKPVPSNELGAKGMAEIVVVPIIPAITNAIYNAVGVRITELPATPERVLLGLQEMEVNLNEES